VREKKTPNDAKRSEVCRVFNVILNPIQNFDVPHHVRECTQARIPPQEEGAKNPFSAWKRSKHHPTAAHNAIAFFQLPITFPSPIIHTLKTPLRVLHTTHSLLRSLA
jgi:hypothetical protein